MLKLTKMKTQQSKGFLLFDRETYPDSYFSKGITIQKSHPKNGDPFWMVVKILKTISLGFSKLFVAFILPISKGVRANLGQSIRMPWFKIGFLALASFIVLRKDISFQVKMKSPFAPTSAAAKKEEFPLSGNTVQNSFLGGNLTKTVSLETKKADPFMALAADDPKTRRYKSYIRRFRKVAKAESKKFGIPASIKMAQALVESDAGQSKLSKRNNNHFGIKCFSRRCKKGHCSNFSDDHHKDFFRIYDSAWESWRAHSKMIVSGKYKDLLKYHNDYRKWATGLKSKGYATSPNYAETLINTIETYHLQVLDE